MEVGCGSGRSRRPARPSVTRRGGQTMNLADTTLPEGTVMKLRRFNIREVETLLSIVANDRGLIAVSRVLQEPTDAVQKMAARLRAEHPELADTPAAIAPIHPMGHRPPGGPHDNPNG